MFWHVQFLCLWDVMEESSLDFCYPSSPPSPEVPMPADDENDVEDVKRDHNSTFPNMQFPIHQENHAKACCNNEETDVTHKALPRNLEGVDQGHACGNNGRYKSGSTKQLSNRKTATVGVHSCKSRKDVRATVSKSQKRHTRQALTHAQNACNCTQIDAQKVWGSDANGAKEKTNPYDKDYKGDGFDLGQGAVIKLEVGYQACFFVWAVAPDIGTLVLDRDLVNKSALSFSQRNV
jgi:hypothetical protein